MSLMFIEFPEDLEVASELKKEKTEKKKKSSLSVSGRKRCVIKNKLIKVFELEKRVR